MYYFNYYLLCVINRPQLTASSPLEEQKFRMTYKKLLVTLMLVTVFWISLILLQPHISLISLSDHEVGSVFYRDAVSGPSQEPTKPTEPTEPTKYRKIHDWKGYCLAPDTSNQCNSDLTGVIPG